MDEIKFPVYNKMLHGQSVFQAHNSCGVFVKKPTLYFGPLDLDSYSLSDKRRRKPSQIHRHLNERTADI